MKNILLISLFLISLSVSAADDSITGTITFTGNLSPKVFSLSIALKLCDDGKDLTTCSNELDLPGNFSNHSNNVALVVGNLAENADNEDDVKSRFVMFEILSRTVILKDDYLVLSQGINSTNNDIEVHLRRLTFVEGGNPSFGLTTLGDDVATATSLEENEAMLDGVDIELTSTLSEVYNQSSDNPATANSKVLLAAGGQTKLTLRGILEIKLGDEATSNDYDVEIQTQLTAKDGNP